MDFHPLMINTNEQGVPMYMAVVTTEGVIGSAVPPLERLTGDAHTNALRLIAKSLHTLADDIEADADVLQAAADAVRENR